MTKRKPHPLVEIAVDLIDADEKNPRLDFPEDELARLRESISREGVLVPVVVYKKRSRYQLIDGERRFRCTKELAFDTIPALVLPKPTERERLLRMFNIHLVRDAWADMPTAWALKQLISETGIENEKELAQHTGLSKEKIQQYKHILSLPSEYQDYVRNGQIPLNFFWELKRNLIDPMARKMPETFNRYGGDRLTKVFVDKRLDDVITDVVSLRHARDIVNFSAEEDTANSEHPLRDQLERLIEDKNVSVDEIYTDTVMIAVEADKLERNGQNLIRAFNRLRKRADTIEEREHLLRIAESLKDQLVDIIQKFDQKDSNA